MVHVSMIEVTAFSQLLGPSVSVPPPEVWPAGTRESQEHRSRGVIATPDRTRA
jgi:hypothetical protein